MSHFGHNARICSFLRLKISLLSHGHIFKGKTETHTSFSVEFFHLSFIFPQLNPNCLTSKPKLKRKKAATTGWLCNWERITKKCKETDLLKSTMDLNNKRYLCEQERIIGNSWKPINPGRRFYTCPNYKVSFLSILMFIRGSEVCFSILPLKLCSCGRGMPILAKEMSKYEH